MLMYYLYAIFLITQIFSFTSTLDYKFYAVTADILKLVLGLMIIYYQNYSWFGLNEFFVIGFVTYIIFSVIITCYFYSTNKRNELIIS